MASNRSSNEWPSFGKISPFLDLVEDWRHFSGWIKTSGKFPLSKMRRLSQTWKQRRTSERNQHPLKQREPNGNEINNVKDNNDNCNKVRTAYFFALSVDQITVWVRTWSHLHRVGVIFYLCCFSHFQHLEFLSRLSWETSSRSAMHVRLIIKRIVFRYFCTNPLDTILVVTADIQL